MKPTLKPSFKLGELVHGLNATIQGNPECLIYGISPIYESMPGHITFLTNSLYKKHLPQTKASAVILTDKDVKNCPVNAVVSSDPYYIYAKIASFFAEPVTVRPGIHQTVQVGAGTEIDPSASIAANCVIGRHVKIGPQAIIGPGCVIGDFSEIGEGTRLDANVSIYHHVQIGKRTRLASGVVIGGDGFGFAFQQGVWHKVPQLGGVIIGDDVEIGANTTIDRGAIENTVIENGVKMDNLIQVAHNVRIGENTVIAGCVGIAGSARIGRYCAIGGAVCINGHVTICDNVMITGMSGVDKSIREPGIYSSGVVGILPSKESRKNNARFHRFRNLIDRVKNLESTLRKFIEGKET